MAFLDVYPSPTRQQQTQNSFSLQDHRLTTKIIEYWIATTDNINTKTIDVLGATGLPQAGLVYSLGLSAINAICTQVNPQRSTENPLAFEVQVEYTIPNTLPDNNPAGVKVACSSVQYTQQAYYDKDGTTGVGGVVTAIVNSARQPFDPAPTETYFDEKLDITYQQKTPPFDTFTAARGRVNSDTVIFSAGGLTRTYTPRTILLADASWDAVIGVGVTTWNVSISLINHADGFTTNVLDEGYAVLSGSGLEGVKDVNHEFLNSPVMLDGAGNQLPPGGQPQFKQFKIEKEAAMSGFLSTIH